MISTFLNEKIRDRVEFSDVGDIQQHLEQECIPKNLGGMWNVNHSLWMSRCIESYMEGNCDEPCFQLTAPVVISGGKSIGRSFIISIYYTRKIAQVVKAHFYSGKFPAERKFCKM